MKFTFSSLKKYLKTDATLEQICEKLNNIGLEVESVHDAAKDLAPFTVAKIIEAKPHPESTKLQICMVDVGGSAPLQIICGAKNARSGLKVAYAPIGSVIPANGMVIKKAKIAGVESNGMLCSAAELGLGWGSPQGGAVLMHRENKDAEGIGEGIIEVDDKFSIGTKVAEIFGLNEVVIEINITPNRGDCLGTYGIARDLASSGLGTLINPQIKEIKGNFESPIKCEIHSKNCEYFSGFYIKNVKNIPSPKWLADELKAIGQNSISAIVDITNYVMMQSGQPLHTYDADKLSGNIFVADANANDEFKSLKDIDYKLKGGEVVIKNNNQIIGLAGVIGGANSLVSENTQNIFLEAAFFEADAIAKTGRSLNILSDARYRFERGVDLANINQALKMAASLILEICATENTEISNIVHSGNNTPKNSEIEFDLSKIKQIIGIEIPKDFILSALENLGFKTDKVNDNLLKVLVPSHRNDVKIYQDLIEEIVRLYGLNNITSQSLENLSENKSPTADEIVAEKLTNSGLNQVINYSFINEKLAALFGEIKAELKLQNPIAAQMNYMRSNLIVGLLQNVAKNQARGFENLSLFETGLAFFGIKPEEQKPMVAGIRIGKNKTANHYKDSRDFDVFDVKKDLFATLEALGFSASAFLIENTAPAHYHPHRSATLKMGKNIIGYFGEIHPIISKKLDVKGRVNSFEILLSNLPINLNKKTAKKVFVVSDLLPLTRDFAFILDEKTAVGDLLKTVGAVDKELITQVNLFDIYHDKKLGDGKKSIAFEVRLEPKMKTLTSEEIEVLSQKIIKEISEKFGATLRS